MPMNLFHTALAVALLLALAACSPPAPSTASAPAAASSAAQETSASFIGAEVRKGMAQAKQKMATANIDVDAVHIGKDAGPHATTLPKAVITPRGDLLIADKAVAIDPQQRTLLLGYRQEIVGIAEAGMGIGTSGADLGMSAAKAAILGAFSGQSDQHIAARIQPQAEQIKAAALALCQRLPKMLASQQQLAAALPAFKPYATMTQKDIDDCGKDTAKHGKQGLAVFSD